MRKAALTPQRDQDGRVRRHARRGWEKARVSVRTVVVVLTHKTNHGRKNGQRDVVDPTFGVHCVLGRRPKPIAEEFFGSTPLGRRETVTVNFSHLRTS